MPGLIVTACVLAVLVPPGVPGVVVPGGISVDVGSRATAVIGSGLGKLMVGKLGTDGSAPQGFAISEQALLGGTMVE